MVYSDVGWFANQAGIDERVRVDRCRRRRRQHCCRDRVCFTFVVFCLDLDSLSQSSPRHMPAISAPAEVSGSHASLSLPITLIRLSLLAIDTERAYV